MTPLSIPTLTPSLLVLITALGYVVATVGMKGAAMGHVGLGTVLAVAGFAIAFIAEVALMRQTALSVLYILILGVETVLILGIAYGLGEGFTVKQGIGAALVIAGLMAVAA